MKSYCTQNNGDCTTCSLTSYDMDCKNNSLTGDYLIDADNNKANLQALINACREALNRIEKHQIIILENLPYHKGIIDGLEKLNVTRIMPII